MYAKEIFWRNSSYKRIITSRSRVDASIYKKSIRLTKTEKLVIINSQRARDSAHNRSDLYLGSDNPLVAYTHDNRFGQKIGNYPDKTRMALSQTCKKEVS